MSRRELLSGLLEELSIRRDDEEVVCRVKLHILPAAEFRMPGGHGGKVAVDSAGQFTPRQLALLAHVLDGLNFRQIAGRWNVNPQCVYGLARRIRAQAASDDLEAIAREAAAVAATVIDGGGQGSVLTFTSGETEQAVLTGFTITNGQADYGGGVCCYEAQPSITGNVITGNQSRQGGGICVRQPSGWQANLTITNNGIHGNGDPAGAGGGIHFSEGSPTITNNLIKGNGDPGGIGGGIYFWTSNSTIADNTIQGNGAQYGGGIYFWTSNSTIADNTIQGNSAEWGGGIMAEHTDADIANNAIEDNAAEEGGGIWCYGSLTIRGNTIEGNTAQGAGGGIHCYARTGSPLQQYTPTITHNLIVGNSAGEGGQGGGGGLHSWESGVTLSHNVFAGNSAPLGGAISMAWEHPNGAETNVRNNTFSHNSSGYGGSLEFSDCPSGDAPMLTNNIIAFDTQGAGILVGAGAPPIIQFCNAFGNAGDNYYGMSDPTGSNGNISVDPLFAAHPNSNGDFHLKSSGGRWTATGWVIDAVHSPCIDAGDPSMPAGDG